MSGISKASAFEWCASFALSPPTPSNEPCGRRHMDLVRRLCQGRGRGRAEEAERSSTLPPATAWSSVRLREGLQQHPRRVGGNAHGPGSRAPPRGLPAPSGLLGLAGRAGYPRKWRRGPDHRTWRSPVGPPPGALRRWTSGAPMLTREANASLVMEETSLVATNNLPSKKISQLSIASESMLTREAPP